MIVRRAAAGLTWLVLAVLGAAACGGSETATTDSAGAGAADLPPSGQQAASLPGETSTLPASSPAASGEFRLAGNEPFWGVRVTADGLTYTTPDYQPGIVFTASAPQVTGATLRWVALTPPPNAHTLEVVVEEKPCQDSMADATWTFTATVVFDGTTQTGCGERIAP